MAQKKVTTFAEVVAAGAAITGAALGAAAVALSDKKNQQKVKKVINNISDQASEFGKSLKKKVDEYTNKNDSKKGVAQQPLPAKKPAVKRPAAKKAPVKTAPVAKKAPAKRAPSKVTAKVAAK